MNVDDARLWLETVHGGIEGWIDLRAIDPDQKRGPRIDMVRTTSEALAWCERWDDQGFNLYAGLARRGDKRNENQRVSGEETNLTKLHVLWADLDDGKREAQLRAIREFPIQPTLVVDSGGGLHPIWRLEEPIECAATPETNAKVRNILKGIQVILHGDRAVVDPARIFRVAGTMNYPNARKRNAGRGARRSCILEKSPYTCVLEDFDDIEERGRAEFALESGKRTEVHGHSEILPANVELILKRVPRMRKVFFCEERLRDKSPSEEDLAIASGLFRYAPWLSDADVEAAIRYRRVALAHLVLGSEKSRSYYRHTVNSARQRIARDNRPPDFGRSRARWFQWVLGKAVTAQRAPEVIAEAADHHPHPRIETGVAALDSALAGGIYAFTALVGDSGVGKSTLALNTAIHARMAGWKVLYVAAEMDHADYELRASRYLGVSLEEARKRLPVMAHVCDGLELEHLCDLVMTTPDDETEHLLVVLDSLTKVSAFVDRGDDPHSLFDAMAKLVRMAEGAVRWGERRVAFLVTSELNKDREALGRRITYSVSLQVNLMQDREQVDLVNVTVPKARYSPKQKSLGPFRYDWKRHRLEHVYASRDSWADSEGVVSDVL